MSDTYTREQIVRKLKRLQAKDPFGEATHTPSPCQVCIRWRTRMDALNEAIAAFQEGKAGK